MSTVLVTGGAGFIGSHTTLLLLEAGFEVVVVDNLSNSSIESLHRVEALTGKSITFYQTDIRDKAGLTEIFAKHKVDSVIHFAGLKAVGESNEIPLEYYDQNIYGTVNLLKVMESAGCYRMVFSSSATVYGDPASVPITEDFPTSATNPYGRTKLFIEEIMKDLSASNDRWNMVLLRYFNPIGAHKSGQIGEDPQGIPNNLMPFISQVAVGKREKLSIFGNDYPTPDGTGVRDYIHVVDLSDAHVKAVQKIGALGGISTFNLGTGNGYSVLQMVETFIKETGKSVPYEIVERRPGDIAECWADASLAKDKLGWTAVHGLSEMIEDTWRWQSQNPDGFK
ncbi:UDP-glucose 4-epimerase GalE [Aliikangiella sp. G2MR2-5]|uniref:UDP-glucose 4-epimerase GalE n=1 Tax=Aliikangiella sp. G2MR2-5 TaxID=2788943 RepID=UPI0018A9835A|nr:UDP-glucose 4-epimerase GalE [Aliikangiella sp. G2MR2-5]